MLGDRKSIFIFISKDVRTRGATSIFMRGEQDAKDDGCEEVWLPHFKELTRLDFSGSMNDAIWASLDFGPDMTKAQHEGLLAVLKKYSRVFSMEEN